MVGVHSGGDKCTVVWLDANVYNAENKKVQEQLQAKFSEVWPLTDVDECQSFIQRSKSSLILIVSGGLGAKLVPDIHPFDQVFSVYVYCQDIAGHRKWADKIKK
ncbi:unnamed protein product, partial [Rotaria sp. Silwood2]